jgi:hypothetical protein
MFANYGPRGQVFAGISRLICGREMKSTVREQANGCQVALDIFGEQR